MKYADDTDIISNIFIIAFNEESVNLNNPLFLVIKTQIS